MSTTGTRPTIEPMMPAEVKKSYCRDVYTIPLLENLSIFEVPQLETPKDGQKIVARLDPKVFNCVKSTIWTKLSKRNRLNLFRQCDGFHKFRCLCLPGERVLKATLFRQVVCPKDPVLKQKWIDGNLPDSDTDWAYSDDTVEKHYVPLKTVYPKHDTFAFFPDPLSVVDPFGGLSIEVKFSTKDHAFRDIYVDTYTLSDEARNKLLGGSNTLEEILVCQ
jgi:hypothetical protein